MSIFFWLELTFKARKTRILRSIFFCKTKADYAYKLRVQDFATSKNFSLINSLNKRVSNSSLVCIVSFAALFRLVTSRNPLPGRRVRDVTSLKTAAKDTMVCITVSNSPTPLVFISGYANKENVFY